MLFHVSHNWHFYVFCCGGCHNPIRNLLKIMNIKDDTTHNALFKLPNYVLPTIPPRVFISLPPQLCSLINVMHWWSYEGYGKGRGLELLLNSCMDSLNARVFARRGAELGVISKQWNKTSCRECVTVAQHGGRHCMELVNGIVRGWETDGEGHKGVPKKNMFLEKNGKLGVPGPLCNSARFKQHLGDVVNPILSGEGK